MRVSHASAGADHASLKAGATLAFATTVSAGPPDTPNTNIDVAAEHAARRALGQAAWRGPGRLETPDPMLDAAFALQKLHVLEFPVETYRGMITHNGSLT